MYGNARYVSFASTSRTLQPVAETIGAQIGLRVEAKHAAQTPWQPVEMVHTVQFTEGLANAYVCRGMTMKDS